MGADGGGFPSIGGIMFIVFIGGRFQRGGRGGVVGSGSVLRGTW